MAAQRAIAPLEAQEAAIPATARPVPVEDGVFEPTGAPGNPARDLQREVAAAAARGAFGAVAASADDDRWSQRRTLVFILATCGAFWAAVAFAMSRLF